MEIDAKGMLDRSTNYSPGAIIHGNQRIAAFQLAEMMGIF
jgi:hypothetical protein